MKKTLLIFPLFTAFTFLINACKKDKMDPETDSALFNEIQGSGYSYYMNGQVLSPASASPHGSFKLRFNAIALSVLDSTLELPPGTSFPTGSTIVKEVQSGGNVSVYAIMKKDPSNANSVSGWLWAEINPDGTTVFSTAKKGDGCIGCHSNSPNRDLVRTFDLH